MSLLKMKLIVLMERYKQITAVANALQIKQPTVSFHMKKMEEEWGVKLFESRMGKVLLTKHGKLLLHYASQIDQLYTEAEAKLGAASRQQKERFVVGCTASAAAYASQSAILRQLAAISSGVSVSITLGEEEELLRRLHAGTIDLLLAGSSDRQLPDSASYREQAVLTSELRLAAPTDHPLAAMSAIAPQELHDRDRLELNDDSLQASIRRWARQSPPAASFGTVDLLLKAVQSLGAVAILPANVLPEDEAGWTFLPLAGDAPKWELIARWRAAYWDGELMARVVAALASS
ncbi:LysR family transcriptional regulator [Paenibacillus sp. HB172176]|uniref:LysR family transcriptional regulator n=1 Tax=Paenibacillus sp. HB172176 TaxID=2493690 RepID=UPI00143B2A97|nr:LysR family transcriptional regulator [Paenibacillus sp. HB172176]